MALHLTSRSKTSLWGIPFFFLIGITYFVYSQGINGPFIFDDFHNISPIGKYSSLTSWENFWLFLLEGSSGPTGRPVSMASFYLNDNAWPSSPTSFIKTNIMIHLLNGVLIFGLVLKIGQILNLSGNRKITFALLASALWIIHPMHTTTVLYVVQRMTELSTLFTILGLIFFLFGREKLLISRQNGLLILYAGVGSCLILSVLSKENGILLVAYILTLEFFLLRPLNSYPPRVYMYWLFPVVIIPFTLIIAYLSYRVYQGNGFEFREFTLGERLLTQPRVLFDYLYKILLPNVGDSSLFHDDYIVSKNLLEPWTTLPAIFGVLSLLAASIILRKKQPIIAFAIAWFFAGHIIESTVLSLELYFEHRNYLPMLGFLIAASWYISPYLKKDNYFALAAVTSTFFLCTFLVFQNAKLWSSPFELVTNWYISHPNSMRSQEAYLKFAKIKGINHNNGVLRAEKHLTYTSLWNLNQACLAKTISPELLDKTIKIFSRNPIHVSASSLLHDFIPNWLQGSCKNITHSDLEKWLSRILSLENTIKDRSFKHHVHYWLSELYKSEGNFNNAMVNLDKAYIASPDFQLLKLKALYLSSAGLYKEALEVLDDTSLLEKGFRKRIALNIKQKEIDLLKANIEKKKAEDKL